MEYIRELGNVDVYVIDQLLKGAIHKNLRLLDAGCGSGRNLSYFAKNNFNITGIDPNEEHIHNLRIQFPNLNHQLHLSSIEDFHPKSSFDFIICNAVLHFARNHDHFDQMFEKLVSFLETDGTLFIRMTTNMGLSDIQENSTGVYDLPDESSRYLITRKKIGNLCSQHNLSLIAPFKTVLVENWRSMATILVKKNTVKVDLIPISN